MAEAVVITLTQALMVETELLEVEMVVHIRLMELLEQQIMAVVVEALQMAQAQTAAPVVSLSRFPIPVPPLSLVV